MIVEKFKKYENEEVTVIDVSNYNSEYCEKVPFKAVLTEVTDYPCFWVISIVTGRVYELYENQIKEFNI